MQSSLNHQDKASRGEGTVDEGRRQDLSSWEPTASGNRPRRRAEHRCAPAVGARGRGVRPVPARGRSGARWLERGSPDVGVWAKQGLSSPRTPRSFLSDSDLRAVRPSQGQAAPEDAAEARSCALQWNFLELCEGSVSELPNCSRTHPNLGHLERGGRRGGSTVIFFNSFLKGQPRSRNGASVSCAPSSPRA